MKTINSKLLHIVVIVFVTFYGCGKSSQLKTNLSYVNTDFETVLVFPEFETGKSRLLNSDFFSQLKTIKTIDSLQSVLKILNLVSFDGEAILAISNKNEYRYLLVGDTLNLEISYNTSDALVKDTLITYLNNNIHHIQLRNAHIYTAKDHSYFLQSNNIDILKNALSQVNRTDQLNTLYQLTDKTKTVSLINTQDLFLGHVFGNHRGEDQSFGDYNVLDFNVEETQLKISGVTQTQDSTKILNILNSCKPCSNKIAQIFPSDAEDMISLCLGDLTQFKNQLKTEVNDSLPAFLNLAVESAMLKNGTQQLIGLRFLDKSIVESEILNDNIIVTFRDIDIHGFSNSSIFKSLFQPFFSINEVNFAFELDDFFVFAETIEGVEQLISSYTLGQTLDKSKLYQDIEAELSNQSSVLVFKNNITLQQSFSSLFNAQAQANLAQYNLSAFQLIYEDDFAHFNGIISQQKTLQKTSGITELFTLKIDNDIVGNPQFFTNHLNKSKDIVIQDKNNWLYLISKEGDIYWKTQLDGAIIGDISELDIFRNGRIQMAFTTEKSLYILDRNGKNVSGFPKSFKDKITQPLSVFDYDNNKNYRLLVTQNNELLMFDKTGKAITGFKPELSKESIASQPKHFRIGRKDYIVFAQGKTLKVLDRIGKTRLHVKEAINFTENDIYLHNNSFYTVANDGAIIKVDNKGLFTIQDSKNEGLTNISADSKTLVVLNENKLKFNNKTIELDFGNYTSPELFSFNNEKYVSVTDLQSKKAFVFDGNGTLLNHFPIYAFGPLYIAKAIGSSLYGITKSDDRSIVLYRF